MLKSVIVGILVGVVMMMGVIAGCLLAGGMTEKDSVDHYRDYVRSQLAEKKGREDMYREADFFRNRDQAPISDVLSCPLPAMGRSYPEIPMLEVDASGVGDPEDYLSVLVQAFWALPDGMQGMLIEEGWKVVVLPGSIDCYGGGKVIGRVVHPERRIELTAAEQIAMVFLHEIGHIVEKKIRPELIRAGYTSRETLPDIVFHGGADSAYHEELYGEYLANYFVESVFWQENAYLSGKEFFSVYHDAVRKVC